MPTPEPTTNPSVSPLLTMEAAVLLRELRAEIRGMMSPWLTREQAADYLSTTESTIDKFAGMGRLRKRFLLSTPLFHRDDLDALVSDSKFKLPEKLKEQAA